MKDPNIIFITQTDKRSVYICVLTIFLISALIALLTIQTRVLTLTHYFLLSFFSLFVVAAIVILFKFKQIILTNTELKIVFPFLFKTKSYSILDIKTLEEKDYKIEPLVRQSRMTVHEGKETLLEFKSTNDVLRFNTLETTNYFEFIKALKQIQFKKEWKVSEFIPYDSTWSIIAWVILIAFVLTIAVLKMCFV